MTKPSRKPAVNDFHLDVDGIGRFRFAYRKMADELAIAVEYSLITKGIDTPTEWLNIMASALSQLRVLTVEAPEDWDLDEMDPLDDESYAKIVKVHYLLRDKEHSFRQKPGQDGKASGPAGSEGAGVLVPAQVQPAAD